MSSFPSLQEPPHDSPDLFDEAAGREPLGSGPELRPHALRLLLVAQHREDLRHRLVPVLVVELRPVDDLELTAVARDPDEAPGLDHFGDGDAEGLVPAAREAELVPREEAGLVLAVDRAFERGPRPVLPDESLDLPGIGRAVAPAQDVEMDVELLPHGPEDVDDQLQAL